MGNEELDIELTLLEEAESTEDDSVMSDEVCGVSKAEPVDASVDGRGVGSEVSLEDSASMKASAWSILIGGFHISAANKPQQRVFVARLPPRDTLPKRTNFLAISAVVTCAHPWRKTLTSMSVTLTHWKAGPE